MYFVTREHADEPGTRDDKEKNGRVFSKNQLVAGSA